MCAYLTLREILKKCGIEEAVKKACPPSTLMTFIGILFNTDKMTKQITEQRLNEIKLLLRLWLNQEKASLKDIQSLIGKLNFAACCVRQGRIFISMLIRWLKVLYKEDICDHIIPDYVKKDILWWYSFLRTYNGISMMSYEHWLEPNEMFFSDSCLIGCGWFWQGRYFHALFPKRIQRKKNHINFLEMMAIIICLKVWGKSFKGKRIQIFCDNFAVFQVLSSGKAKCQYLQSDLREVVFLAATMEFEIRTIHIESKSNSFADHLSRWYLDSSHKESFFSI